MELKPKNKDRLLYTTRAKLRERAGNTAGAIADLEALVELKPLDGPSSMSLAQLHARSGDTAGALARV